MIGGRVVDVLGRYVKVKTPRGEKVLKMKGRMVPERGWILELRRESVESPFIGSVVLESTDPLPPLNEVVPLVERGISDPVDVSFLSNVTRSIRSRLNEIPKWYYSRLEEYYKKGEGASEGLYSKVVRDIVNEKKVPKKDPMKAFGDWLNTFAHPFYFRSYRSDGRPTRVFVNKVGFTIRIDHESSEHGRVIVEGLIGKGGARLKIIPERPVDQKKLESLRRKLEEILGNALIVQGGKGLGFYV